MSRDDAVKAGAVLLLLVILAGLQKFGLLAGFVEWLKAATVAAICSLPLMSETTGSSRPAQTRQIRIAQICRAKVRDLPGYDRPGCSVCASMSETTRPGVVQRAGQASRLRRASTPCASVAQQRNAADELLSDRCSSRRC